jgi:hypothetical protein
MYVLSRVGLKATIRMDSQPLRSIWRLEHQTHYQEEGTMKYARNGDIIYTIVHCCRNTKVHPGIYFVTFPSQ